MSLGLSDLVKEGTKHLVGQNEALLQNIEAIKEFSNIVRTSLGPNGLNKMVINHLSKLFVTNDAATIIKELDVFHPAAKLVVLASQMQEQEMGDGTNFVIIFAGELLHHAEELVKRGLHPSDIIAGYNKASQKAQEILEGLATYKVEDIKNLEEVSKFLKSTIASKQYGYEDVLAPMIAKACIDVLPKNPQHFNVDNVRVAKIVGGSVLDTQVIRGHVLTRDTETTIKRVAKAKVAVFAAGIDVAKTETKDTVLIKSADELMNYSKSEEKHMEEAGVTVVVSGGAIGEMALHFIEKYKIMAVKTLSKFDLRRVAKACGAATLVRLGAPTPEEIGHCDLVAVDEIGSTKVTIFRNDHGERSGISTIVVRASTHNILDDIERAIDDGVNVFKGMVKDPRFVPGAGATEIELAKQLQAFADATPGLVQYGIKKYGESFEVVPRTIAETSGQKAIDMIASLYAAHAKGQTADGINVEEGTIQSAPSLGVYDLLATKQSAIRLATGAVVTVLQVDQIIMAKPAGGPKVPKQGPVDSDD